MATVRDIMDPNPATVGPDDGVEQVVRTLRDHGQQGVPVVNEGGRCVGIVTEADLVLSGDGGDLHLPHFIELFGGIVFLESLAHFEERLRKATASRARDLMTPDPDVVHPDTEVAEAAREISRTGHNRLPVVEHGRLVGVVTRVDVLQSLAAEG